MGTRETALKNLARRKSKGGRPKGCKNRFTSLKDSFLKAYEAKDGFGGDEALKKFAKANPHDFLNLINGVPPRNLDVKNDSEMTFNIIPPIPEPQTKPE